MRPNIVMPMADPKGILFPHLETVTDQLKALFEAAYVSITPATQHAQGRDCEWLQSDSFFRVYEHPKQTTTIGDDFLPLYGYAAASSAPTQMLHLCYVDRVAYALQSEYKEQFCHDIRELGAGTLPLIFQRSTDAWQTHPQNYRELEQMVTRVGELLFGRSLDFAWCHLAIQAGELRRILPDIHARDFSFEAEMVLLMRDSVITKDVEWLAWEDPFIEEREAQALKAQREASIAETNKRLSYVVPMLQLLRQSALREG
jgi:hypothetical protein